MEREKIEGYSLSPQQRRLWALQEADAGQPYLALVTLLIEGILNLESLQAAVQSLIDRYEILRTTFDRLPGMTVPLQIINEASPSARRFTHANPLL